MINQHELAANINASVTTALDEDLRDGDLTAQLIPRHTEAQATVITRQDAVLCGTAWFNACFKAMDKNCIIHWLAQDGDVVTAKQTMCKIRGDARAMLTAERCALNFLQTLSATATQTRHYVEAVQGTHAKILDTRKTLPGLRLAQKYAVKMGGGHNQRIGLFDGVLIKENHILAAGGIRPALEQTFRIAPGSISIQIEVENMEQLNEALEAGAKLILLDNFDLDSLRAAVKFTDGRAELEASGGITLDKIRAIAETGVERISIGGLTKDIHAIDLSMRFEI
ncbi:carboxylating nicotinate-nucleotide diphosphorylase [Candidatus Nitrotoga sp. M5]|uniref:carboxylating nicotinate-nucleotide diphosphorylase n=1 Tax=Candidatus Nitrotoga sp. M5 TaxID=2890409 RepID=UPI001EF2489D|nr:carboxylating nicotinate-nucleotide diphosphorylase [Candidatus Nitrotoga sp. M5]CAH1386005.1 Nicotinate-nucleotide pyrophosphorylase (carboxylating) [Candidatus Nitrotoga sp. M5]